MKSTYDRDMAVRRREALAYATGKLVYGPMAPAALLDALCNPRDAAASAVLEYIGLARVDAKARPR